MKPMLLAAAMALMPLATLAHSDTFTADLSHWAEADHRSEANVARNPYRHPVQTLEFFGLHPDMTVIELWPGGGWYTEILAPFLRDNGTFIAASFETEPKQDTPRNRYRAGAGKRYQQKLAATPSLYDKVQVVTFDPPTTTRLGVEASAHMVLTFRNLHNWAMAGDLQAVFEAAFEVLTPGGVFGVVEHRANPGMSAESGYMDQQQMIDLAKKVGFRLAASSEINANAKDSKDYPKGVWTLPPSLRLKEQDKQKYLAIGESDRMTLKFYKPEI
ncbi:class I SAM-dependent methyltransferase [Ferrimonas kyonanensis]|uniref:class I SAM-dependent methyltransferase n=1 Tax=Ferrimonas kyonanensis TaxID=364763 RepID=UPI00041DED1E|nr:class I SAM-dependent methyltransferase [Ferrimonas kyonanensis]